MKLEKNKYFRSPITIYDSPYRYDFSFRGACNVSDVYKNSDKDYWISIQDWYEIGPQIIYKKFNIKDL